MSSNLPPGCNSDDGGIDHELELSREELCDQISDPAVARALIKLGPGRIYDAATRAEEMGYDGVRALESLPHLLKALSWSSDCFADHDDLDAKRVTDHALAQARKED